MSPTPTQPVAQGTLASTPFAHLVLYIYQRRSSGTLVVYPDGKGGANPQRRGGAGSVAVLFHRGRAVAARVGTPAEALDQALLPLCGVRDGEYEFFEEDLVGSGTNIVTGMFDPYAFVSDAARKYARDEVIDQVLSRFRDIPLCVQPGMDLERLMLRSPELHFAEVLRDGTATIGTLLGTQQLPESAARRLLYALLVTKVVGPFAPTSTDSRSGPPQGSGVSGLPAGKSSNAPHVGARPSLTPEERRRQSSAAWAAIAARASQASRPLSGPIRTTPTPSRSPTPSPHPRSSTPTATRISTQSSSKSPASPLRAVTPPGAFNVRRTPMPPETPSPPPGRLVSDGPLEQSPAKSGTPRGATPSRPISRVTPRAASEPLENLDAAGKFRRVEQMCARNAFDEALPIIRALVDSDRRNPAYLGLLASVLFGRGIEGTISKEIVDTVNQALRIHPDEVNALYTKARCYKRMGKTREALHYFRRTVAVAPEHTDAAREVRLLVLRQNESKGKR